MKLDKRVEEKLDAQWDCAEYSEYEAETNSGDGFEGLPVIEFSEDEILEYDDINLLAELDFLFENMTNKYVFNGYYWKFISSDPHMEYNNETHALIGLSYEGVWEKGNLYRGVKYA